MKAYQLGIQNHQELKFHILVSKFIFQHICKLILEFYGNILDVEVVFGLCFDCHTYLKWKYVSWVVI